MVNRDKEEEILRIARSELEGIDSAKVEELIKRIEEGRADKADQDLQKRLFRLLDWLYKNLDETSDEEN